MKIRCFYVCLTVLLLILFSACHRSQQRDAEISIGIIAPLSGEIKDLGTGVLEGANLAIGEVNKNGGLEAGGKRHMVTLVVKDSQDKPELAVGAAHELINRENITAIIGPPMSSLAIPVARIADEASIPMIVQIATNPDVTKGTHCVYRVCFTDDFQGDVMAKFSRKQLHARTAAVLYDIANPFNRGIAETFKKKFRETGGKVVAFESYTTGEKDFTTGLTRIKNVRPDVLFLPNYVNEIRLQMDQIRKLDITAGIIGCDTMSFRNREDIALIEGAYFSTHFSVEIPSKKVKKFTREYKAEYGRTPSTAGALTYDAIGLLFTVIEDQGSISPEEICAGLKQVKRYEGVTGIMEFDGSPDPKNSAVIIHVVDGMFRFYTQVDP